MYTTVANNYAQHTIRLQPPPNELIALNECDQAVNG
jgi:hypothetical protein